MTRKIEQPTYIDPNLLQTPDEAQWLCEIQKGLKVPRAKDYALGLATLGKYGGWLSATDMTVWIYGTSGRGSQMAKNKLHALATLRIIVEANVGRSTYYHVPKILYELLRAEIYDEGFQDELIREGSYPAPKRR